AAGYLSALGRSGASVARVTATRAGTPLPLGAFAPLLPPLTSGPEGGVGDRADLLRRCAGFLVDSAGGRPLVLSVDDAHLLDDLSATLVHQMAATGAALVVATLRSDEPAPDPIVALWKDDGVERLEVSGLDASSVEQLLLAVLGGPVDRGAVHRLEIRLGHSLYGDVIRSRTPALRGREVARLLAEAVEATGARRREDVLRVATWRLAGGTGDPQLMYDAARLARGRYDFPLAQRLAQAAVQAGAGFDAALLMAQLASLQGRGDEAEGSLGTLAEEADDDRQRGLVACARLDNLVFHMGRIDAGLAMAEAAERHIADPAWRDELV